MGIVKDATECTARVELHSSCQTISVDRENIKIVGQQAKYGILTSSFSRTPVNAMMAPGYCEGSITPMHRSMTPNYEVGNRTPHNESMTSPHDGSITSIQVWNPTFGYTSARVTDDDLDYPIDSGTPYAQTPNTLFGSSNQSYSLNQAMSPFGSAVYNSKLIIFLFKLNVKLLIFLSL